MNSSIKTNAIYGFLALVFAVIIWQATSVLFYLLISTGIAVVGNKIALKIEAVKIKKRNLPRWLIALVFIGSIYLFSFAILSMLVPLVSSEIELFANIDFTHMLSNLQQPIAEIDNKVRIFSGNNAFSIVNYTSKSVGSMLDIADLSFWINGVASFTGNFIVALFCIAFISFFLMKDGTAIFNTLLSYLSEKSKNSVQKIVRNSMNQLSRYFIGVAIETAAIFVLAAIGLWCFNVEEYIIIALFAAVLNIIPFIGPIIAMTIACLLVITGAHDLPFYSEVLPLIYKTIGVLIAVHLIDSFVLQPYIYSSSVNAHPLEIFLVILLTGNIAGIVAMIFAVPAYSVLRIVITEFYQNPNHIENN